MRQKNAEALKRIKFVRHYAEMDNGGMGIGFLNLGKPAEALVEFCYTDNPGSGGVTMEEITVTNSSHGYKKHILLNSGSISVRALTMMPLIAGWNFSRQAWRRN